MQCVCGAAVPPRIVAGQRPHRHITTNKEQKFFRVRPLCRYYSLNTALDAALLRPRKSVSDGLERDFTTLDAQRESCESYIASQKNEGWICLPEEYDDGGFTGANTDSLWCGYNRNVANKRDALTPRGIAR